MRSLGLILWRRGVNDRRRDIKSLLERLALLLGWWRMVFTDTKIQLDKMEQFGQSIVVCKLLSTVYLGISI
jgi:hypothetical protein